MGPPDVASRAHGRAGPGDRRAHGAFDLPSRGGESGSGGGDDACRQASGGGRLSQAGRASSGDPGRRAAFVLLALAAAYVLLMVSLFRPSGGLLGTYQV